MTQEIWESIAQIPELKDTLTYFDIMYGPWDRLNHNLPFWGSREKPKGATFYPETMTTKEFEDWVAAHPDQKAAFTGYFTVIVREGEELKAVVQLKPGATATADDLIDFCRDRLADYKRPRSVDFVAEVPRNPSGKLLKREIRAPYWEGRTRRV